MSEPEASETWLQLGLMNTYRAWTALLLATSCVVGVPPEAILRKKRKKRNERGKEILVGAWLQLSSWLGADRRPAMAWLCQVLDLEWETVRRLEWEARKVESLSARVVSAYRAFSPRVTPGHALVAIGAGLCGPSMPVGAHAPGGSSLLREAQGWMLETARVG